MSNLPVDFLCMTEQVDFRTVVLFSFLSFARSVFGDFLGSVLGDFLALKSKFMFFVVKTLGLNGVVLLVFDSLGFLN